jgi:hypothetical protein
VAVAVKTSDAPTSIIELLDVTVIVVTVGLGAAGDFPPHPAAAKAETSIGAIARRGSLFQIKLTLLVPTSGLSA